MHGLFGLRLDRHGGVGVELPVTLAADDQVAIVVLAEPGDGGLGSDAAVDDHEGAGRRVERVEHAGQGAVFADVAGEDLRAADEAAGIEHQTEGQQGAIAAPLFRVPALGLRLLARLAFEIRVGQVVEGDGRLQVEEPEGAVEQVRLDRVAMLHQLVRGAVELHGADGLEVDAEQLAEAAALLQPAMRLALGGRVGHAPDDDAGRRCAQRAIDTQAGQQVRQADLVERPQTQLLDADAAGADQAQRVDVDPLDVGRCAGRHARLGTAGEQLRGDALRFLLDGGRAVGRQRCLAVEYVGDAGAQQRPVSLGNVEVAPEVEQRALAHGVAEAFGVDHSARPCDVMP